MNTGDPNVKNEAGTEAEVDENDLVKLSSKEEQQQEFDIQSKADLATDGGEEDKNSDIEDTLLTSDNGIVGVDLKPETVTFFDLEDLGDKQNKWTFISLKRVNLHIFMYESLSEFAPFKDKLKFYQDLTLLIGLDVNRHTGHSHYLCVTLESRNNLINPPAKKRKIIKSKQEQRSRRDQESFTRLSSITPHAKWKNHGSDLEVNEQMVKNTRPLVILEGHRDKSLFSKPYTLQDATWKRNFISSTVCIEGFDSIPDQNHPKYPQLAQSVEIDRGIQVHLPVQSTSTQTPFAYKRNKMTQHEIQSLDSKELEKIVESQGLSEFLNKVCGRMERALQQNEMVNLAQDDYAHLKADKGYEVEFNNESILLQEYITITELKHTKDRVVTALAFHPVLEDVVLMSVAEDLTVDKRIESHSKILVDPNFLLLYDLKEPDPQMMFDAPSDIFCFMVNPSNPQLICGGCANGQVVLWDSGNLYNDLRRKIENRKRKASVVGKRKPSFIEKLKDNAEKYICPLVAPCGLSNLQQSHQKIVTSINWLPPHVELSKNGQFYENSLGGKSVQFFSLAGDGTVRLWDIRPPKSTFGVEESTNEASQPNERIRSSQWHHLGNNAWKRSLKFNLADGDGNPMQATHMFLSEQKNEPIKTYMGSSTSMTPSKSQRAMSRSSSSKLLSGTSQGEVVDEAESDDEEEEKPTEEHTYKQLPNAHTTIFLGTANGKIALVDWQKKSTTVKDHQVGKNLSKSKVGEGQKVCQNLFIQKVHDGPVTCIATSPFHYHVKLVVGGGTISLWKEPLKNPIMVMHGKQYFPWSVCWSQTRPGVFFVGTREGALQIWDLTDRSHSPVLTQQITNGRITCCSAPKSSLRKKHFLSLADSLGNLYVMLVPKYFYKPIHFENSIFVELMNREGKRTQKWFDGQKAIVREQRNEEIFRDWTNKRMIKSDEEAVKEEVNLEKKLNQDYYKFLEYQKGIVGYLKRTEPELPTEVTDVDKELDEVMKDAEKAHHYYK